MRIEPAVLATSLLVLCPIFASINIAAGEVQLRKHDGGVAVMVGDKLFADYLTKSGTKPIVWPIIGPTGCEMTRNYPMKQVEGEKKDHPHQRSFWFTYGEVNGIDFWGEPLSYPKGVPAGKKLGSIVHRRFKELATSSASSSASSGGEKTASARSSAVIVTENDWVDSAGKKQLEDERRLVFTDLGDRRLIDFDIVLKATAGDVDFGDTKEGALGIRIPTVMDVDAKHGGRIVNSDGRTDKEAWGKRAAWVDYHGPVDGQTVGIAVLNHPSSFRAPTFWHVRTYGLFAANPFGLHDFEPKAQGEGGLRLRSGDSITLRYRVVLHRGDEKQARIDEAYQQYAGSGK